MAVVFVAACPVLTSAASHLHLAPAHMGHDPLEVVATALPRSQTAPPMPVQMPLPPMPPIGKQFLPTLGPAAARPTAPAAALSLLGEEMEEVEQLLGPSRPASTFSWLKQDPLAVTSPPGTQEAAQEAMQALHHMLMLIVFVGSSCLALAVTFVAYQYKVHKADPLATPYQSRDDFQSFQTGLCDCWHDLPLCCFITTCPWIRWAENMSMVSSGTSPSPSKTPILGFWVAFGTFLALTMLCNPGGILVWVVTACVLAYFRQKLRQAFSMKNNTGSCLQDCLGYLCCCYCIIAQDARHLEEAKKQEHSAIVPL